MDRSGGPRPRGAVWYRGSATERVLCCRKKRTFATVRVLSFRSGFCFWLSARRAATHRGDGVAVAAAAVDGEADDGDDDDGGGDNLGTRMVTGKGFRRRPAAVAAVAAAAGRRRGSASSPRTGRK